MSISNSQNAGNEQLLFSCVIRCGPSHGIKSPSIHNTQTCTVVSHKLKDWWNVLSIDEKIAYTKGRKHTILAWAY